MAIHRDRPPGLKPYDMHFGDKSGKFYKGDIYDTCQISDLKIDIDRHRVLELCHMVVTKMAKLIKVTNVTSMANVKYVAYVTCVTWT